ncbi:hypothetical protein IFM89_025083, partial [Coptis chinensis]
MGKGMYRVVHIPEDEVVLLNSREKGSLFDMRGGFKSHAKDTSNVQKLSRGIPLANGDAQLHKPPPWAYLLWSSQDVHRNGDRMLSSTSQAIDQAMSQSWEAKVNFVHVGLSVEKQLLDQSNNNEVPHSNGNLQQDVEDQEPPRQKEHRRVPSTIAIEEVKVGLLVLRLYTKFYVNSNLYHRKSKDNTTEAVIALLLLSFLDWRIAFRYQS